MSEFDLDTLLGEGTRGYVRRVGNTGKTASGDGSRSGSSGRNARGMVAGSPEVMVKISGFGRGKGVMGNLAYISRDGKLDLETSDGLKTRNLEDVKEVAKQWKEHAGNRNSKQRDSMNLVLSMPAGTDPAAVAQATRLFAQRTFARHDYVWVQHTDEDHPHTHLTVALRPKDHGPKLNPRKADLQAWREGFAEALREQGVDCAATPRRARGITRKPDLQILRHMRHDGREPRVDRAQKAELLDALRDPLKAPAQPWERAIVQRQRSIREHYGRALQQLAADGAPEHRALAAQLHQFVRSMPAPQLRKHEWITTLRYQAQRREDIDLDIG
jgi:hypothetical protein